MSDFLKLVRNQNFFIIATLSIVIGSVVGILIWDLNRQNEDAIRINLAGKQRTLSQRFAKRALYTQNEIEHLGRATQAGLDSLAKIVREWEKVHYALLNGDEELGVKARNTDKINSLLAEITPLITALVKAGNQILSSENNPAQVHQAVETIEQNELKYLQRMETVATLYQREAESKLKNLKMLVWVLGGVSLGLILLEFLLVIRPVIGRLTESNKVLNENNTDLEILNKDLQASEEELRSNLDQISFLQSNLEEREKQYRNVVEGASDMIYELDEKGKFIFVNEILVSISEYSREELYQRYYSDLVSPDYRERLIEFYREQRTQKNENTYFEFMMLTQSGREIWIGQNTRMFFNDFGAMTKVNVVARDISELKDAARKLSQERILLRTIIDNVPINIYAKNKCSQKILANRSEFEYVGASSEQEILNKDDFTLYPDESALVSIEEDKRVFNGETILNLETVNTRHDGSQRWFLISKVPLRDEAGDITGLVGISMDITEQKKAQHELESKERLYRLLSENSQDVVSLNALDGSFEYVSPACESLHGYTPEELVGRMGTDFIFPDDVKKIEEIGPRIRERWKKNEPVEPMQFRLATKKRGLVWVENVMKPRFEDGELVGFQSTLRDISLRKEYELALEQAKEKAEGATRAKSQFLSMMSHEIRTPMNAIIGLTNLLLEDEPRVEQVQNLELLKFSGDNLLTIINDILDFSKIEAGKMELEKVSFNLPQLLQHHVQILSGRANEKKIGLVSEVDVNLPALVKGDPVRLGQVLNNLLSNAIKFTEKGKVQLTVKLVSEGIARFDVSDTGIGIAADKTKAIFESFTQASSDTTRKFGGTGLGLSITKRLLLLMDADIEVTSEPGKGSVFTFYLSLEAGHDLLDEDVVVAPVKREKKLQGRVLLAEDNRVNQIVAVNFLQKWGIDVSLANDGNEAVNMVQEKSFDLVLMDLQMPGMDGYEASRTIRKLKDEYFQQIPIIALTAEAMAEIREETMRAGMNDYISKPFQPQELFNTLAKHLKKRKKDDQQLAQKLSHYTDNDPGYKKELVGMLIKNLDELNESVALTIESRDMSVFKKVVHKMKTTLSILSDPEFDQCIKELGSELELALTSGNNPDAAITERFIKLSNGNRTRLHAELT